MATSTSHDYINIHECDRRMLLMYNDDKFCGESCTFDIYPFTRLSCCLQIFNGFDWHLAAECHRICTLDPRHMDITPHTESKTELNERVAKRDSIGGSDTFVRRETNDRIRKRDAGEHVSEQG